MQSWSYLCSNSLLGGGLEHLFASQCTRINRDFNKRSLVRLYSALVYHSLRCISISIDVRVDLGCLLSIHLTERVALFDHSPNGCFKFVVEQTDQQLRPAYLRSISGPVCHEKAQPFSHEAHSAYRCNGEPGYLSRQRLLQRREDVEATATVAGYLWAPTRAAGNGDDFSPGVRHSPLQRYHHSVYSPPPLLYRTLRRWPRDLSTMMKCLTR